MPAVSSPISACSTNPIASWQRPDQIMDSLGVADGSVVADIGAGSGWFTIRLARRVGPQGLVYAEDVQKEMINAVTRRVSREGLANVRPWLGQKNDPNLPAASIDAVLIVDAYHGSNSVAVLRHRALVEAAGGSASWISGSTAGPGPRSKSGPPRGRRQGRDRSRDRMMRQGLPA